MEAKILKIAEELINVSSELLYLGGLVKSSSKAKEIAEKIWSEAKENDYIYYNVGYRGGGVGIPRGVLARLMTKYFDIDEEWLANRLPKYFGAGCNYLGGGIRGQIFPSDYDDEIDSEEPEVANVLNEIAKLAVEEYEIVEEEIGLEEYDPWGWEATQKVRGKNK